MLWYRTAPLAMMDGQVDLDDQMTVTLHTSSYVPDLAAHDFVSDLTNELPTSGGYTAGGLALGVMTRTKTEANSWAIQRAGSTAYVAEDVVRPAVANGFLYRATNSGTTGGSLPTYPLVVGQTVVDGGVTWENVGRAIIVISGAAASWATATFGPCRYAVLSDRSAGAAASQPLLGLSDFAVDKTGGGGTFQVTPHASLGYLHILIP